MKRMPISGPGNYNANNGLSRVAEQPPTTWENHSAKMAYLVTKNDNDNLILAFCRAMKARDLVTVNAANESHGQKNSPEYSRNYNGSYDTLLKQIRYEQTESPKIDVYC